MEEVVLREEEKGDVEGLEVKEIEYEEVCDEMLY